MSEPGSWRPSRLDGNLLRIAGCIALIWALLCARALYSARLEWQAAEHALERGKVAMAVMHLRRSASWHVPFSPYTQRALSALADVQRREQAREREPSARLAERARVGAEHAARAAWQPLPNDPSPLWSALALLGWLGFCAAALLLVVRGLDATGQLTRLAVPALLGLLGGFLLMVLGLSNA